MSANFLGADFIFFQNAYISSFSNLNMFFFELTAGESNFKKRKCQMILLLGQECNLVGNSLCSTQFHGSSPICGE